MTAQVWQARLRCAQLLLPLTTTALPGFGASGAPARLTWNRVRCAVPPHCERPRCSTRHRASSADGGGLRRSTALLYLITLERATPASALLRVHMVRARDRAGPL